MNSKLRKNIAEQIKLQQKNKIDKKLYEKYSKKADLILNFQLVKAYYGDRGANINSLINKILREKYKLPQQEKIIRKTLLNSRGNINPKIKIPQLHYEENKYDILAKFIKRNFNIMVADAKPKTENNLYPLKFRELIENYN